VLQLPCDMPQMKRKPPTDPADHGSWCGDGK
jgi:hypothetical protein